MRRVLLDGTNQYKSLFELSNTTSPRNRRQSSFNDIWSKYAVNITSVSRRVKCHLATHEAQLWEKVLQNSYNLLMNVLPTHGKKKSYAYGLGSCVIVFDYFESAVEPDSFSRLVSCEYLEVAKEL